MTTFRRNYLAFSRYIPSVLCSRMTVVRRSRRAQPAKNASNRLSRLIVLKSLCLLLACMPWVPAAAQWCQPQPPPPTVAISITPASCTSRAVLHITYTVPPSYSGGDYFVAILIGNVVNGGFFKRGVVIRS